MFDSLLRPVIAASFLLLPASLALAQGDEPVSFEGQTITLIVPSRPGGGSDFQGRILARHMPKHLPGNPDIVVQNVPGGGGIKGIAYFLEINPDADLTFAMVTSSLPFRSRMGKVPEEVFDPREMQWIGSASDSTNYCAFRVDAYDDLAELAEKEVTLGFSERSGMAYATTEIIIDALDWKPKIVTGYENNQARALAVERGEIDGTCSSMDSYPVSMGPVVDRGIARMAFYYGPHRRDDIEVPFLLDLPMSEEKQEFVDTALWSISFGRPFALHPDADPKMLPIFREAFEATLADPEFLDEAERSGVLLRYTSGEEIEGRTDKLYATSDELLSKINAVVFD